jgi:cytochrome c oxidase assembly factor CtaG
MKTALNKNNRIAGRWMGRSAAGLALSALGLVTLVFAFLSGLPGASVMMFALEAAAGLLLMTVGFVLMVLGAANGRDDQAVDNLSHEFPADA